MPFAAALAAPHKVWASSGTIRKNSNTQRKKLERNAIGKVTEVVKKDAEFIKEGIGKGLQWANKTFRIPKLTKSLDDLIWLRHVEDPRASSNAPSWPHPHYPAQYACETPVPVLGRWSWKFCSERSVEFSTCDLLLVVDGEMVQSSVIHALRLKMSFRDARSQIISLSNYSAFLQHKSHEQTFSEVTSVIQTELSGIDLFVADLKALETYLNYFCCISKRWTKPLPETFDLEQVSEYFNLRPHVVALRLLEVFVAFTSAAIQIRISGLLPTSNEDVEKETSNYIFGKVLKETMLNLGPTFIKIGQSLSTRPDIIGSEITKALSELHDRIPPFPTEVAMKIIEEDLGSPITTYFSYISEEPVAAASFGQVYRGSTLDGSSVAVKVQRPDLRHVVVRDVYILRVALGLVQKIAKRKNDLRLYADELGKGLVGELDYTCEAENAMKFKELHSTYSFIRVPNVYQGLSGKRVLTMEWLVGESPTDLMMLSTENSAVHQSTQGEGCQSEAKRRLLDLVNKGVQASLIQLLDTGLLHADPHPGNLRYTSSAQIGFLDFGLLCHMKRKHQYAMLASIVHIVNGDWGSLLLDLTEMDVVKPGTNLRLVTMDLEDALGEVEFKGEIPDIKFSLVLSKIVSVAFKYHFRMPPYFTLLLRSLASLEGLAVAGDPSFKTFEAAFPYVVRKLLSDNSVAARKILHSVVLNRKKEFHWQKLSLFLRMAATSYGIGNLIKKPEEWETSLAYLNSIMAPNPQASLAYSSDGAAGVFDVANLVLRILPSKDGIVLRRLLMTADGTSLVRAFISKEAKFFRQNLCKIVADILSQWIFEALGSNVISSQLQLTGAPNVMLESSSAVFPRDYDYKSTLRDRRLKLILFKVLGSARKSPILMMRFFCSSCLIFIKASALACHRILVCLSNAYLDRVSLAPWEVVVGA
ncbi:hypothetical protein RND71_025006 [Anisodus tanguticus]|uniref:Protein kinase domain-containing protein n=1 Tax=Anisodus tanguticus TaxID=243964 RepID=A0AAE1VD18_9SOLA|nr:hypothetical protein RND71_025006 [Anisodus tanguticus]